jgi:hypothetical protein
MAVIIRDAAPPESKPLVGHKLLSWPALLRSGRVVHDRKCRVDLPQEHPILSSVGFTTKKPRQFLAGVF